MGWLAELELTHLTWSCRYMITLELTLHEVVDTGIVGWIDMRDFKVELSWLTWHEVVDAWVYNTAWVDTTDMKL